MSRTAFSERSPDNAQYFRKTLAQRLYLPQLRQPEGLGTCRQALHLRMRRLRPTNFRDRQNRLPSQPPAASHLVPSISPQGLLRRIRLAPLANFSGASIGGFVPAPSRKAQPSSAMASRPIEISRIQPSGLHRGHDGRTRRPSRDPPRTASSSTSNNGPSAPITGSKSLTSNATSTNSSSDGTEDDMWRRR